VNGRRVQGDRQEHPPQQGIASRRLCEGLESAVTAPWATLAEFAGSRRLREGLESAAGRWVIREMTFRSSRRLCEGLESAGRAPRHLGTFLPYRRDGYMKGRRVQHGARLPSGPWRREKRPKRHPWGASSSRVRAAGGRWSSLRSRARLARVGLKQRRTQTCSMPFPSSSKRTSIRLHNVDVRPVASEPPSFNCVSRKDLPN